MRNHSLTFGEVVFDLNKKCFGVITAIGGGKVKLSMVEQATNPNLPNGWCKYQNKCMLGYPISDNDLEWETNDLEALYQIAWGVKDVRTGNIVCYEHQKNDDNYPYYSPYLEENLLNFEVEFC